MHLNALFASIDYRVQHSNGGSVTSHFTCTGWHSVARLLCMYNATADVGLLANTSLALLFSSSDYLRRHLHGLTTYGFSCTPVGMRSRTRLITVTTTAHKNTRSHCHTATLLTRTRFRRKQFHSSGVLCTTFDILLQKCAKQIG